MYFIDSSALVKRYVPETGSSWIQSITDRATSNYLGVTRITWVEVNSAFARRQREGSLEVDELNIIEQKFRYDFFNQYDIIEVDRAICEVAGQLVLKHLLRAYDAVQLASALRCRSGLTQTPDTQLIFVSADNRLLNIAQTEGLVTDNPNNYS